MNIRLHPHALERIAQRGTTVEQVEQTVREGERFAAKYGRTGFRHNFTYNSQWRGRHYAVKQVEAYAAPKDDGWLVITVIVKFF